MSELRLRNRQRAVRVNSRALRQAARSLLSELLPVRQYALDIHLVGPHAMSRLNTAYRRHAGVTDVLAFDYLPAPDPHRIHGEILLCPAEAVRQGRRYRTPWTSELLRYLVHGVLHLRGYDDHTSADRRVMKRAEDRLLRALIRRHPVAQWAPQRNGAD